MSLLSHLRGDIADDGQNNQVQLPLVPGDNVTGPGPPSKDNGIATWNGTSGDALQSTPACVDPSTGDIDTPGGLSIGGKLQAGGSFCLNCRVVTSAGDITIGATDFAVMLNKTVGEATLVTLPATTDEGRLIIIKDIKGDAMINNIRVEVSGGGTIDGFIGFIMSQNYQSLTFLFCGSGWNII
jgi:hypothetical protein